MKLTKYLITGLLFSMFATSANAIIVDFRTMANGGNERGEAPLTVGAMTINGLYNNGANTGYAYLDSGWGGLGVCQTIDVNKQCSPTNDDNVTTGETLNFVFSTDMIISRIWFNNNHDGDVSLLGDTINIDGNNNTFVAGDQRNIVNGTYVTTSDWLYSGWLNVAANTNFDINFVNESFYVTAIEFRTLPEPTILSLLALGLIGVGAVSRRRKA